MRKNILKRFWIVLIFPTILSCKINLKNFEAECYEMKKEGFVTVVIKSRKIIKRITAAQKQAIYSMLYIGTSGAFCYDQKALLKKDKEIKEFRKIERKFFSRKGDWSKFCSNYIEEDLSIPTMQNQLKVTVAYNQLRIYLEEKKIIKSLNNGF